MESSFNRNKSEHGNSFKNIWINLTRNRCPSGGGGGGGGGATSILRPWKLWWTQLEVVGLSRSVVETDNSIVRYSVVEL